jgi:uncharacterized ion transporter superfamily protein YfcC
MKVNFRKVSIPHVFIFLSAIILFSAILTYIVPSGQFERKTKQVGHIEQTVIIPGSYQKLDKNFSLKGFVLGENMEGKASPTSLLGLFTSIPKGMNQSAALIFFVFIIGAVFNLISHTGTINVVMFNLLVRFRTQQTLLLLSIFIFVAAINSFMGMGPMLIPLVVIFLYISKDFGYDRVFGVALFLMPMTIGWTTAITNPFTVQIAQSIAEVPIGSGMGLRIILFVACIGWGFWYLMKYGKKIKDKPHSALMKDDPFILSEEVKIEEQSITRKHILILLMSGVLFVLILYAVQTMGWGLIEMTGGFFTVGLLTILISGMSGDESMKAIVKGLEQMIIPALIVGFARGIQVVMQEGLIIDTMLFHTSNYLETLPKLLSVEGMFVFQVIMNFFIPSASGQALVSMPLMTPLSDLLGITRQTAVLAFILGDGFSNTIIPTNGVLMAILGIAGVPYEKWVKFIMRFFLYMMLVSFIVLGVAVLISY